MAGLLDLGKGGTCLLLVVFLSCIYGMRAFLTVSGIMAKR
jgi:hypothetical protein